MNNIARWEEVRLFAYIFLSLSGVFFVVGSSVQTAAFGTDGQTLSVLSVLGTVMKDTATACGTAGGVLVTLSEGWKRR